MIVELPLALLAAMTPPPCSQLYVCVSSVTSSSARAQNGDREYGWHDEAIEAGRLDGARPRLGLGRTCLVLSNSIESPRHEDLAGC